MGIRPFSWGSFGNIPDPPELPECDGEFYEDKCRFCSSHDECKKDYEEEYPLGRNDWQE